MLTLWFGIPEMIKNGKLWKQINNKQKIVRDQYKYRLDCTVGLALVLLV